MAPSRADPTPLPWTLTPARAVALAAQADLGDVTSTRITLPTALLAYAHKTHALTEPSCLPTSWPVTTAARSAGREVEALPPAPSSAHLFLYAVGTLGAWQATRSARKLHLCDVPAWLHTGGPAQVGHAVVANPMALDLQPLPAILTTLPEIAPLPVRWQVERTLPSRSQSHIIPEIPRAPPQFR